MSRIPRVPTAIVTAAALLAAGLAVLALGREASAATERPYFTVVSKLAGDPSYRSAVSSDGKTVAYQNHGEGRSYILVGDLENSTNTRLPTDLSATTPSISGDGGLISFLGDEAGTPDDPVDPQILVANRRDPANIVIKPVTGTANDLPYQRMMTCAINTGDGDDEDCEPELARDGRTLVAPVDQSIDTDALEVTVDGVSTGTDRGLHPLVDLGAFATSSESTIAVQNTGLLPIVYPDTGPVLDGDSRITVKSSTCAATLQPGATCTVVVAFTASGDCTVEADAVLRFPATTSAAGQTAVKITGGGGCLPGLATFPPQPAAAAAAACTGPSQYKGGLPIAEQPRFDENKPHPWFPIGQVGAGEVGLSAVSIQNVQSEPITPVLTSAGCQLKLVLPADAPADACRPNEPMPPQSTCTAFVEYLVPDVTPFSGSIDAGDTVYRVGGHAARQVVAAWRDPGGTGSFGPARIASVTGPDGTPMDGTGPTVSADGRYVGFVSNSSLGRAPANPNATQPETQVYLHDLDAEGNGTRKHGETTLVSQLTDGTLPLTASEPSLSDDGTRIAFTGWKPVEGAPNQNHFMQVYVRDLPGKRSILASAGPDGTSADRPTRTPVLSGDGYTVVYLSAASNLGTGNLPADRVIARDLTKDFAGGRGTNDLVSVREEGPGTNSGDRFPAVTPDGTRVVFASNDVFDRQYDSDSSSDVFLAHRRGSAAAAPNPLDFGAVAVGTTVGPRAITVTNDGTAPIRFAEPWTFEIDDFSIAGDQCTNRLLRPGQSCSYLVEFTPKYVGARRDQLEVYGDGAIVDALHLELAGRGTSSARASGETTLVSTTGNQNTTPAISDNGQFVAYRTGPGGEAGMTSIRVKDQASGEIRQWAEHAQVGPPSMSGDGARVTFEADDLRTRQVMLAEGPGRQRALSGTTDDLRYQRPGVCSGSADDRECRPAISRDGKTVAFPAWLDPRADWLNIVQDRPSGDDPWVDSLVDFGTERSVTLRVAPDRAVRFTGPPVIDAGSRFTVASSSCNGELARNASCTIALAFTPCAPGERTGVLRLPGATPNGQTAISLISNAGCSIIRSRPSSALPSEAFAPAQSSAAPAPAAAPGGLSGGAGKAACQPIPPADYEPWLSTAQTNAGLPLVDHGSWPVGLTVYGAVAVAPQPAAQTIRFQSGCEFALVTNTKPDPQLPRPCVDGETLPANTGCTAYVGFRVGTIDPAVAFLTAAGGSTRYYRFAGSGYQEVVLTRTEQSDGTFGEPEIASRDSAGAVIDGHQPSLSADGRYLAFVTSADLEATPLSRDQIYRRDRVTGQTVLASRLPDGDVGLDDAIQPSLSADGNRLAFMIRGYSGDHLTHSGSAPGPEPAKGGARAIAAERPSQVWARDIAAGETVLVSAAADRPDTGANGWSYEPSMSDDGSTVGFTSDGSDLVREPGTTEPAVYVRYLEPDFTGQGERFTERISLTAEGAVPEEGASVSPALNSDGAFTAFQSGAQLVSADREADQDIYVRRRPAQLVASPAAVDFGAVQLGKSSSDREMVVRNLGPGPADAGPASTAAPFSSRGQVCQASLHRGESCVIDAAFEPITAGRVNGLLTVPSVQGYLPGPSVSVGLTGTGSVTAPVAGFGVTPDRLVFGAHELGEAAPPAKLVLRNTGQVPLEVPRTIQTEGDFGVDFAVCATVMPGMSCELPVTFAPRQAGTRSGTIVFRPRSTDPVVANPAAVSVTLSGTGQVVPGQPVAAMTVAPRALVFGQQVLLTPSAPRSVVVRNTGTAPLVVSAVSTSQEFTVSPTCGVLLPGRTCDLPVRFTPTALGLRTGGMLVSATTAGAVAPFPVAVALRGVTATPVLKVDPPVVRPGQVVLAEGTSFPPNRPVVLAWKTGIGTQQAVTDATGRFETAVLVFRRDFLGQRFLTATTPSHPQPIHSPAVLVMPLAPHPPNFVLRW